jgi:hypothetical protein
MYACECVSRGRNTERRPTSRRVTPRTRGGAGQGIQGQISDPNPENRAFVPAAKIGTCMGSLRMIRCTLLNKQHHGLRLIQ